MARGVVVEGAAGWGGLAFGSEMAGMDVRAAVEINPRHAAAHKANLPYCSTICGDLRSLNADKIRKLSGLTKTNVDAMTFAQPALAVIGGPPCQGVSRQGKRDPDDPRNQIIFEWARLVAEFSSDFAVMEQVPGLMDSQNEEIVDRLCNQLVNSGYNIVEPITTLDARDFGVPQARKRVVVMAHRRGTTAPAYPTPTHTRNPESGDIFLLPSPTVEMAFAGLPDVEGFEELWDRHWVEGVEYGAITGEYAAYLAGVSNDPEDYSFPRIWDRSVLTCSQRTRHTDESIERFMATEPGKNERGSRRHRLDPNGHSLTLRAGTGKEKGSFTAVVPIHTSGRRVVTVREAMRLHSIPDFIQLSPVKITALQQVGNSVPPRLARAVMAEIRKAAGLTVEKPVDPIRVPLPWELNEGGVIHQMAA